jgi:hypothetical protein
MGDMFCGFICRHRNTRGNISQIVWGTHARFALSQQLTEYSRGGQEELMHAKPGAAAHVPLAKRNLGSTPQTHTISCCRSLRLLCRSCCGSDGFAGPDGSDCFWGAFSLFLAGDSSEVQAPSIEPQTFGALAPPVRPVTRHEHRSTKRQCQIAVYK